MEVPPEFVLDEIADKHPVSVFIDGIHHGVGRSHYKL